jgi:serine/threonine protein kinase/Tol biopolymer transport system component
LNLEVNSKLKNRYLIEKVIARGGMGSIYLAFDTSLSVQVAVKENQLATDDYARQFHREAKILAGMRHPNLPRVTDHFVLPGQGQYLVMDYIEGEDLKDRIERLIVLPEEEVVLIGSAICDALTYLHTRTPPIVHRDIKPGNIKITPDGEVYLVDFGIAKISSPDKGTTTGAQSLTPGFAPPEQYGQGTSPRSDIYSLGATLYLALTGIVPKNGLARLMKEEQLTPIQQLNPDINRELANTIEKALETQSEFRHLTAEIFKQSLLDSHSGAKQKQDQMDSVRIEPSPTVIIQKTNRVGIPSQYAPKSTTEATAGVGEKIKKKRKISAATILIGVGLIIACVAVISGVFFMDEIASLFTAQGPTPTMTNTVISTTPVEETATITSYPTFTITATEAVVVLEDTPQPTPTETLVPDISPTPANTPQGGGVGQIAFVSDRSGTPQIYLINIDGSELTQITNEIDGACQPDWSPDGSRFVFTSPCRINPVISPVAETYKGSSLFIIDADGRNRTPLTTIPGGDFDPDWSPDGKQILFTSYRDNLTSTDLNLYIYDVEGNIAVRLTSDLNFDRRPAWSPDGDYIVFQRQPQGAAKQIYVMSSDGSDIYVFSDITKNLAFMPDWGIHNTIVYTQGSPFPQPVAKQFKPGTAPEATLSTETAWDPKFSPDGFWIIFERLVFGPEQSRNHNIFIMQSTGGTALPLTEDPSRDYQPDWRPLLPDSE